MAGVLRSPAGERRCLPSSRLLSFATRGVCRGAEPLCREFEGVPQYYSQIDSPFLVRKGARGLVASILRPLWTSRAD